MSGYATPILQWLNQNPELAGLAVFIVTYFMLRSPLSAARIAIGTIAEPSN